MEEDDSYILFTDLNTRLSLFCKKLYRMEETSLPSAELRLKSNTPGPHLMRIHLVRYSTSARYEKYSIIHLVRPIIHLVRIFALSTS